MMMLMLAAAVGGASPARPAVRLGVTPATASSRLSTAPAAVVPPTGPTPNAGAKVGGGAGPGGVVAGAWRLTEVGGRVDCTLTLKDDDGRPGREIQAPIACQRAFPPLKQLNAWSVGGRGAPVFTGDKTKPVTFTGPSGGPYSATSPDGKTWRLTAAPEKAAANPAH